MRQTVVGPEVKLVKLLALADKYRSDIQVSSNKLWQIEGLIMSLFWELNDPADCELLPESSSSRDLFSIEVAIMMALH